MNLISSPSHIFQVWIAALMLLLLPMSSLPQEIVKQGWWSYEDGPLGKICESDQETVSRHLGCSCSTYSEIHKGFFKADCSNNWIGYNDTLSLPPRVNVSLLVRILDLSKNYLKAIDTDTFGECEAVQALRLSDNEIQSFKGVSCPRVMTLDLSRNRLKNLTAEDFSGLARLVELNLSFNELLFLDPRTFEQLKGLRSLNLASNNLGLELFYGEEYMLSLANLTSLRELDLSNSSLPDFPRYLIQGTSHLRRLSLRDNLIQFISSGVFEEMGELETLDLSGNLFEEFVPNQFLGLSNIQTLVLDKMRKLTTIREHALGGLPQLHELSCQMNYYLTYIDPLAFRGDPDVDESTDSHPKVVRLGDNDLQSIGYPLLAWQTLDILELHRNSWICDCNLQWASDFYKHKPKEAAILADSYFNCYEPHIFAGVSVVNVNPEEMLCFSPAATIAGTIGIVIFGIVLFSFCSVIILNQMGMLPDWVRQYNIFGSGSNLPTYTRVNPKPSTKAKRIVERVQAIPELHCYTTPGSRNSKGRPGNSEDGEPVPEDLEWDTADIGRT